MNLTTFVETFSRFIGSLLFQRIACMPQNISRVVIFLNQRDSSFYIFFALSEISRLFVSAHGICLYLNHLYAKLPIFFYVWSFHRFADISVILCFKSSLNYN